MGDVDPEAEDLIETAPGAAAEDLIVTAPGSAAAEDLIETAASGTPAPAATTPAAAPPGGTAARDRRDQAVGAYVAALALDPHFAPHADVALERLGELGQGGMGVVYRVRDRRLGRQAALKVMRSSEDAGAVERFLREARLTALLDHPSIPPVYEAGTDAAGRHYLLMRVIEGQPLSARARALRPEGRLEPAALRPLLEALVKVGEAVAYAHSQGVVHRDLKPPNVMVGRFGEVLVMDWGVARRAADGDATLSAPLVDEAGVTQAGAIVGTPGYMPPEQAEGQPVDGRADVFALGAILVEVLTGRPPIDGPTALLRIAATVQHRIDLPRDRRRDVPAELHDIAARALAPDPAARTPSAEAFVADLRAYLSGGEVRAHRYTVRERALRAARAHPTAIVAASAGALLLALASVAWLQLSAATRRAQEETRGRLALEARAAAQAAWAALEAGGDAAGPRTGRALHALQTAQRWHDLQPADRAAAEAQFRAAVALGDVALRSEQWDLAAQAFDQARVGVDDDGARARGAQVETARRAESERRRREVEGLLDAAERGELSREVDGLETAVFAIVRYPEAQTIELLAARLEALAAALVQANDELFLEAEVPTADEARAGQPRLDGLREALRLHAAAPAGDPPPPHVREPIDAAAERLERRDRQGVDPGKRAPRTVHQLMAARQRERLGQRLEVARLTCEALGRLGRPPGAEAAVDRAVEALGRYLFTDGDQQRVLPAAIALCRLDGPRAVQLVHRARARFRGDGPLISRIERHLRLVQAVPPLTGETASAYYERGSALYRQGRMDEALADLGRALELDPGFDLALLERGNLLLERGEADAALTDFTRHTELLPQDARGWVSRARVLVARGDLTAAIADCDRALALDPGSTLALGHRAEARRQQGDLPGALADFSAALALDPTDEGLWVARCGVRFLARDFRGALADSERALALAPDDARALDNRAWARQELGDLAGALEDCERALALDPRSVPARVTRGNVRLRGGDERGALADYDAALALAPDTPTALSMRAIVRRKLGDLRGAVADGRRATQLAPRDEAAWNNLASALQLLGEQRPALEAYTQALALSPDDIMLLSNRAMLLVELGDTAAALRDYDRALALRPGEPTLLLNRGCAKRLAGDFRGAIADLDRSLARAPRDTNALFERGQAHVDAGDRAAAIADFDRALALDPGDVGCVAARALVKQEGGDLAGAIADYTRALELDPRHVMSWYNRGVAHVVLKDMARALSDFERAVELRPDDADYRYMRGQLRHNAGDRRGAIEDLERMLQLRPEHPGAARARARLEQLRAGD